MRGRSALFLPLLAPAVVSQALRFHPVYSFAPSAFPHNDCSTDSGTLRTSAWRNTTGRPLISNETSNYVEQLLDEWDSTGLSLAVVQKDSSVTDPAHPGWRVEFGSFGFASKHSTRKSSITRTITKPMTPDTLFAIASNSKLFLSISVGLLIHNRTVAGDFKRQTGVELSWKTRMRDLLGADWTMWDEDIERGSTIADLLGHRTGMPRHDYSSVQRKGNVKEMVSATSIPSKSWSLTVGLDPNTQVSSSKLRVPRDLPVQQPNVRSAVVPPRALPQPDVRVIHRAAPLRTSEHVVFHLCRCRC